MAELMAEEAEQERLSSIMNRQPWKSIDRLYEKHQPPLDELQEYLKLKKLEHLAGERQSDDQKLEKFKNLKNTGVNRFLDLG